MAMEWTGRQLVDAGGSLIGYGGGLEVKRGLLELEMGPRREEQQALGLFDM